MSDVGADDRAVVDGRGSGVAAVDTDAASVLAWLLSGCSSWGVASAHSGAAHEM